VSEEEEEDDDKYSMTTYQWTHGVSTPAVLEHIATSVKGEIAAGKDIALPLQHVYFNKGGLTVETLKGGDRLLWDALAKAGVATALVACRLKEAGYDDDKQRWTVGHVGPCPRSANTRVHFLPGSEDKKFLKLYRNPGAEHTGNEAMAADSAYLGAVVLCYCKPAE